MASSKSLPSPVSSLSAAPTPPVVSRQDLLRQDLSEAQRIAVSAGDVGRATLCALEGQNDNLRKAEDTLEANEYVLRKSKIVLRGMSWSGWLYNKFLASEEPVPESTQYRPTAAAAAAAAAAAGPTAEEKDGRTWQDALGREGGSGGGDDESKQLEAILAHTEDLKHIAMVMGSHVVSQTEHIGRIDEKTDRVRDKTLEVTLKAAQYTTRSNRSKPRLLGRFQLIEVTSGEFLAAVGEDLVLMRGAERATFFDIFQKDNLFGIQNAKTLKFIGSTFMGSVKCSGNYFGKQEEVHIGNVEPTTMQQVSGILILAKNWGRGGWLRRGEKEKRDVVDNVTTSVSDKSERLTFRSVFVQPKEKLADEDS